MCNTDPNRGRDDSLGEEAAKVCAFQTRWRHKHATHSLSIAQEDTHYEGIPSLQHRKIKFPISSPWKASPEKCESESMPHKTSTWSFRTFLLSLIQRVACIILNSLYVLPFGISHWICQLRYVWIIKHHWYELLFHKSYFCRAQWKRGVDVCYLFWHIHGGDQIKNNYSNTI